MSRTRATVGLAVVAVAAAPLVPAGCGGSGRGRVSGTFAWLRPAAALGLQKIQTGPR